MTATELGFVEAALRRVDAARRAETLNIAARIAERVAKRDGSALEVYEALLAELSTAVGECLELGGVVGEVKQ